MELLSLSKDEEKLTENEKKKTKKYDFYMVEPSQFPESRIKRVLQYFNLILFNKIKDIKHPIIRLIFKKYLNNENGYEIIHNSEKSSV